MANRSRQTFIKRQKERARQEKARIKSEKRERRNSEKVKLEGSGEDPDIAGMVPGPQLQTWEMMDVLTDDEILTLEQEAEEAAKKAAKEAQ